MARLTLRVPARERATRSTFAYGSARPPQRGACGILLVWLAFACSGSTGQAVELALDPAESTIFFIGVKNDLVAVPGSFTGLTGAMDPEKGTGWVEVAVSSVATGDEERDSNMLTHFFEATRFPLARFELENVDPELLPPAGGSRSLTVTGTLELHGSQFTLPVPIRVSREAGGFRVQTSGPLLINAADFGMERQVQVLKAVCGHETLSATVPIQVDLLFIP